MQVAVLRQILAVPTMIALAVAVLLMSSADTIQASNDTPEFVPTFGGKLCNPLPAAFVHPGAAGDPNCTGTKTPSTDTDLGQILSIPEGHHNFSPGLFVQHARGLDFKTETELGALGTLAGGLRSTTTLGLTNNVCGSGGPIFPEFVFWNAETDTSNTVAVQAEGTADRFSTLATDGGDGFPTVADADSAVVTSYPDINNTIFNGAQPIARYAGLSRVPAASDWQLLQVFIFEPDELRSAFLSSAGDRTNPYARLIGNGSPGDGLGTLIITVLNDPSATAISTSPISDFCAPLGVSAGFLGVATTPAASGNYALGTLVQSIRNADDDGYENSFDTCQFADNTENQLSTGGFDDGPDGDNFDSICDPTPATDTNNGDHDDDGFPNAQDGCPVDDDWDSVLGLPAPVDSEGNATYLASAPDGGPRGDAIWDDCDPDDVVSNGKFFMLHEVDSYCIEDSPTVVDNDDDGWCDNTTNNSGVFSNRVPKDTASTDSDGDGTTDNNEILIGTDSLNDCTLIPGHDAWPADFDMDRSVTTIDVFKVLPPVFGSAAGSANYTPRADLDPDGSITTIDVFKVLPPVFGTSCTP